MDVYRISDDVVSVEGLLIIETKPGKFFSMNGDRIGRKRLTLLMSFISDEAKYNNQLAENWVLDITNLCGIKLESHANA